MKHKKAVPDGTVERVFPNFGEPVLTFDRVTYYNGYREKDRRHSFMW